jgi:Rubrerythrin.
MEKGIIKEGIKDLIEEIKDTKSALDFAIQRELDSILFYHEIRELVLETQKKMVNEIIREERKHFEILSQIRKKYDQ